jgi:hypothetical protein
LVPTGEGWERLLIGVPEILLIAPDGTIVARGLRGKQIDDVIAEQLK